jgi:hypothetical protein
MIKRLIEDMQKNPSQYQGTFSFAYGKERITQVIFNGKHVDSIMILGK